MTKRKKKLKRPAMPGAGRPKTDKEKTVSLSFRVPESVKDRLHAAVPASERRAWIEAQIDREFPRHQ